jgi:hypothetical protein
MDGCLLWSWVAWKLPGHPNWPVLPVPVASGKRAQPDSLWHRRCAGKAPAARSAGCLERPRWPGLADAWHHGMQPCPLSLVELDLVAVEVYHQNASTVGAGFGFAVELDAALFQCSVLAYAVVGFDAE